MSFFFLPLDKKEQMLQPDSATLKLEFSVSWTSEIAFFVNYSVLGFYYSDTQWLKRKTIFSKPPFQSLK